jgi:uncharacterized phage protein gp47/JayE
MSFAAEPYGVFVDDLVSSLTGGSVREQFVFLPEQGPFRLSRGEDVLPETVRIHGVVDGGFVRFQPGTDFEIVADGEIGWLGAVTPEPGSRFYASYETAPDRQAPPRLSDRNVGSVLRILAESTAREYAVLSRQLELVYRAAFLDTAEGADLDHLGALLGVERRTRLFASGEVVFSRTTAAPADVVIPAGTLISSSQAPSLSAETTDDATLRAGTLSVAVPVRALVDGPAGAATAGSLTVIRRPILGVDEVVNAQALRIGGDDETDTALRRRMRRALETSGAATVSALVGALTAVEGIREQDVRVGEDHVARPGVLTVTVAADLDEAIAQRALAELEAHRPAGIRLVHDLPVPPESGLPPSPPPGSEPLAEPGGLGPAPEGRWFDVAVRAVVLPASTSLPADQQARLATSVADRLRGVVADLGVGEPVVHARLVAAAMGVEGVADVVVQLFPAVGSTAFGNVYPPDDRRARLLDDDRGHNLFVTLRGALVALDVTIEVEALGLATLVPDDVARTEARRDIGQRLADALRGTDLVSTAAILGALPDTTTYHVKPETLDYLVEFVQEGLLVQRQRAEVPIGEDQLVWVRSVTVPPAAAAAAVAGAQP